MDMRSLAACSLAVLVFIQLAGQSEGQGVKWTKWTDWTPCSVSCGFGLMTRTREQIQPNGMDMGDPLTMTANRECWSNECPTDGGWQEWGRWTPCTEACGGGVRDRKRSCTAPRPQNGGKECDGEDTEEKECNKVPCPPLPAHFNLSACAKNSFNCTSGRMCIPLKEFCDDTVQCHDGSDEKKCYTVDGDKLGSVRYSYVKDTASSITGSLSVMGNLVAMVIVVYVIG